MPPTSPAASHAPPRLLLTLGAASAMLACADRDLEPLDGEALAQTSSTAPMSDAGARLPYFASLTLNGTGCPASSWNTWISADGHTFNTRLSKYEATVQAGQRVDFKDCNISVKLHSDTPLSWAVDALSFDGYAYLERNVRGFAVFKSYFLGTPVPPASEDKRIDFTGPVDRSFRFDGPVADASLVWSPCDRDRTLQILSRIGLQKQQDEGSGYIDLSAFATESGSGRIRYGLRWRPCVEDARDAGGATSPDARSLDARSLDAGVR